MKLVRIKNLREDRDLTQSEMARLLNISQRAFSHYENGNRNIPIEMLIKIADIYNVSLDYLVGRSDKQEQI